MMPIEACVDGVSLRVDGCRILLANGQECHETLQCIGNSIAITKLSP